MIKKLLLTSIFISSTLTVTADEVSVFGAGDLDSKNPYGLNSAEKNILKNKKTLGSIDSKVKDVKYTVGSLSERIDGLESIYEGDSQKLNKTVIKLNEVIKKLEENSSISEKNSSDIQSLKTVSTQILTMQEEISSQNKKNITNLKKAISKLTNSVNKLNKTYVSEKELESNMNQFITRAEFEALKKSLGVKTSNKTTTKKKSNKVLSYKDKDAMLAEAKELFKKDYFSKAIPMFEELVELNFKPAEGNFYLGEMWYYRKKYEEAISYFKTSAMLYDKADYMPKLLLHSAISFEKIKDYSNAANFYNSLIGIYPDSKEAKIATKNLSSIK
ncbi:tetratricopeptide repeat protein [Halarcobacter sp.]|uniref:tetratricopeptide repeat protein n=1 Tax=Halarcobacter sp. TaxID=2321133 RepID=UPI003B006D97